MRKVVPQIAMLLAVCLPTSGQEPLRWVYQAEKMNRTIGEVVTDNEAEGGQAIFSPSAEQHADKAIVFGPYTVEQPAGHFRATFRLKVSDNTPPEAVVRLDTTALSGEGYVLATLDVKGTDFTKVGQYQELSLEYDRPDAFVSEFRVMGFGRADVWIDRVVCQRLQARSDAKAAEAGITTPRGLTFRRHSPSRVLVLQHSTCAALRLAEAAEEAGAEVRVVGYDGWAGSGSERLPAELLASYEEVFSYDAICLGSVYAGALGVKRRQMLYDFVQSGGGLLLAGGPRAFGQGGYLDTRLAELSPLELLPRADSSLLTGQDPRVGPAADSPLLRDLRFDDPVPMALCLHQTVRPKPGTQVLLAAGANSCPVLAAWKVGQGRVAAITVNPQQQLGGRDTDLWEWPGWQTVARRTMIWLAGG